MSAVTILASPKLAHHETIHQERVLLDRVLRGEERARSEFVVRYSRLIYHTLYSAGVSRDAIEDMYQMVQVHLWTDGGRRLRLWRADGTLSGYLVTITARFARTHQHANRCRMAVTELPIGWEPADRGDFIFWGKLYAKEASILLSKGSSLEWPSVLPRQQDVVPEHRGEVR